MYDESAESYAALMDGEIDLPIYADVLGRLAKRLAGVSGALMDTSCGPGHMLLRYHEQSDGDRELVGIDLSPRMVALASASLGPVADIRLGDMRNLDEVETDSVAAVLSFFAIHHIDPEEVALSLREWKRVLCPGGQLVVAAWEGTGPIDYGDESEILALCYTSGEIRAWAEAAGFAVDRCLVEPVSEMPMDALYFEGTAEGRRTKSESDS